MHKKQINIPIGGFLKQSLIDYPGHIAGVVFTRGCNFRCAYCHNPELVLPAQYKQHPLTQPEEVLHWIDKNKLLLDAMVITGGEPTMHCDLPEFISRIKATGIKVKLDTNGTNPAMLNQLIEANLLDYVAMDIKAPLTVKKYSEVVGQNFDNCLLISIKQSIKILMNSSIDYEFRTTLDKSLGLADIKLIAQKISGKYYIQNRRENGIINSHPILSEELEIIKNDSARDLKIEIR